MNRFSEFIVSEFISNAKNLFTEPDQRIVCDGFTLDFRDYKDHYVDMTFTDGEDVDHNYPWRFELKHALNIPENWTPDVVAYFTQIIGDNDQTGFEGWNVPSEVLECGLFFLATEVVNKVEFEELDAQMQE